MSKKKPQEQRMQEIMEAAVRCFAKKGYDKTKMEDIVKESGLTKGGIYWYYKSKREIFMALLDRHVSEDKMRWSGMINKKDASQDIERKNGIESLRDIVDSIWPLPLVQEMKEHLESDWVIPLFVELTAEAFRDRLIKKKMKNMIEDSVSSLKSLLAGAAPKDERSQKETEHLAMAILSLGYGLGSIYKLCGRDMPFEEIFTEAVDMLLHGFDINHIERQ